MNAQCDGGEPLCAVGGQHKGQAGQGGQQVPAHTHSCAGGEGGHTNVHSHTHIDTSTLPQTVWTAPRLDSSFSATFPMPGIILRGSTHTVSHNDTNKHTHIGAYTHTNTQK